MVDVEVWAILFACFVQVLLAVPIGDANAETSSQYDRETSTLEEQNRKDGSDEKAASYIIGRSIKGISRTEWKMCL